MATDDHQQDRITFTRVAGRAEGPQANDPTRPEWKSAMDCPSWLVGTKSFAGKRREGKLMTILTRVRPG